MDGKLWMNEYYKLWYKETYLWNRPVFRKNYILPSYFNTKHHIRATFISIFRKILYIFVIKVIFRHDRSQKFLNLAQKLHIYEPQIVMHHKVLTFNIKVSIYTLTSERRFGYMPRRNAHLIIIICSLKPYMTITFRLGKSRISAYRCAIICKITNLK